MFDISGLGLNLRLSTLVSHSGTIVYVGQAFFPESCISNPALPFESQSAHLEQPGYFSFQGPTERIQRIHLDGDNLDSRLVGHISAFEWGGMEACRVQSTLTDLYL